MNFRKDINGLRAIAVLAVVFFHFKIIGFSGGFVGVDVFFVISGYLMTSIIFNKLRINKFSIIEFYSNRAKRIIPALAFLCICIFIFGFFFLLANDYKELQKNIESTLLFTSNIYYYQHSSYFDTASQENWMLHTWSLSVEWQFYLLYPIIVSILYRIFLERLTKLLLIGIMIIFFLISVLYYANYNPAGGFYLLPSRAWEMLAGGMIFLYPMQFSQRIRQALQIIGMLLILLSILFFSDSYVWPSFYALVPVIGTMLVLQINNKSIITENKAFQFIGKISYSIYLWHWPIAVFLYLSGDISNPAYVMLGVIISIIFASLSYFLIEKRIYKIKNNYINIISYALIIYIIIIGSEKVIRYNKKNHPIRSDILEAISIESSLRSPMHFKCFVTTPKNVEKECVTNSDNISLIVAGDSYSDAMFSGIAAINKSGATMQLSSPGCLIMENIKFKPKYNRDYCTKFSSQTLDLLDKKYQGTPVILINRIIIRLDEIYFDDITNKEDHLNKFKQSYIDSICKISKKRPVYIVKPTPIMPVNVPKAMVFGNNPKLPLSDYIKRHNFTNELFKAVQMQCNVTILDPTKYLCDQEFCYGVKDNKPLYYDNSHLSDYGNKILIPLFETINNFKTK